MDYGGGYSTTSYGAQGGAGGGGFMSGSQGGSQPNKGNISQSKDTLRPCTIKQVLDATQPHPDAEFKIDDIEVQQITFVGQIRNISTQATNITYKLDDGTGTVEVKQWIDSEASAMDLGAGGGGGGGKNNSSGLVEDEWARVWGRLKAFNNRRHVGAHVIRPVADKMEITHHLLEATYVHLYCTRGPLEPSGGKGANGGGQMNGQYGGDGDEMGMGGARGMPSVSPNARRVLQCLKETPQNNEGLNVQHVAASLRMPLTEVMKAGDELLTQSLIFTTVDDSTWAVLDL
ncbi:Replication factor A protein 2 [Xanthoria parietina]